MFRMNQTNQREKVFLLCYVVKKFKYLYSSNWYTKIRLWQWRFYWSVDWMSSVYVMVTNWTWCNIASDFIQARRAPKLYHYNFDKNYFKTQFLFFPDIFLNLTLNKCIIESKMIYCCKFPHGNRQSLTFTDNNKLNNKRFN